MNYNEVLQYKLLSSHLMFVRYFFKKMDGNSFIVNWHHEELCDIADDIFKGKTNRDIINLPPRYSKTEIFVVMFVAHGFALNPKSQYIHISAMDGLVKENSEKIRDLVMSEAYQAVFPYVKMKPDSNNKGRWKTTQGGGLLAASAGGQITGFGAGLTKEIDYSGMSDYERMINFGGGIVIDDSIKPDDASSVKMREQINYRYDSTYRNRLNCPRQTPIINIQQRVDENDLSGYLVKNDTDKWNVHTYEAMFKRDGETIALWEHKHTLDELIKLRKANEQVFDTQYMQNPKPKAGLMFPCENIYTQISTPKELRIFVADPADAGKDLFAGGYFVISRGKIYLEDVVCNRKDQDWNVPACIDMINNNNIDFAYCESNGKLNIDFKKAVNKKITIQMRGIGNSQNKHSRIWAQSGFINDNFVFKESTERHTDPSEKLGDYETMMLHTKSYTKTGGYEPDDPPDMLALASRIIRKYHDSFLLE